MIAYLQRKKSNVDIDIVEYIFILHTCKIFDLRSLECKQLLNPLSLNANYLDICQVSYKFAISTQIHLIDA